jgi:CheY-like chemotaxis protein
MDSTSPTVLLVDDDSDNRELVREFLREAGLEVWCARDGAEALASIRVRRPDAVLLDYIMPTMDGAALARALRESPATQDIGVVMVSGLSEAFVRPVCSDYDVFLAKPYSPDQAVQALEQAVRRRGGPPA